MNHNSQSKHSRTLERRDGRPWLYCRPFAQFQVKNYKDQEPHSVYRQWFVQRINLYCVPEQKRDKHAKYTFEFLQLLSEHRTWRSLHIEASTKKTDRDLSFLWCPPGPWAQNRQNRREFACTELCYSENCFSPYTGPQLGSATWRTIFFCSSKLVWLDFEMTPRIYHQMDTVVTSGSPLWSFAGLGLCCFPGSSAQFLSSSNNLPSSISPLPFPMAG